MQNWRVSSTRKSFETKASLSNWQLTAYQIYAVQRLEKAIVWNGGNCEAKKELMDSDIRDEQYPKSCYILFRRHYTFFWKDSFFDRLPFFWLRDWLMLSQRMPDQQKRLNLKLYIGEISLKHFGCVRKTHQKGRTTI